LKFFLLIIAISSCLFSDITLNKQQKKYVEEKNPELYNTYMDIKENESNKEYVVFLFVSLSVPHSIIYEYVNTSQKYKNKIVLGDIYFKGLNKDTYLFIKKSVERLSKTTKNKIQMKFDPTFYEENNLSKVPLMALSICDGGDYYPSACETLYTISGTSNVDLFMGEIFKVDEEFKIYMEEEGN